ncbi:hypothetical protein [Solibacillus cecembensis]|uniref:hypothetical protein n=1 Tax=Solibacillus cecembensis TaxID=459347 RepID=UPI003CFF410B
MAKGNKNRVITTSNSKVMIRYGELTRILNKTEIVQWHNILQKIRDFDEKEMNRLNG